MNAEAAPRSAARKRKSRWAIGIAVVLVVVVAAVAAFTLLRTKSTTTTNLSTATAKKQTLSVLVSGTGTTVVSDSVTVNPKISGTVKELYVSLGETVSAGDRLYKLTSDDVEAQKLQAKASLLQSEQSLDQAQSNKTQAENQLYSAKTARIEAEQNLELLQSKPATSTEAKNKITLAKRQLKSAQNSVESARDSVSSARTGIEVAQANHTSSEQEYEDAVDATHDTIVTAPIDGVITELPISVGSDVSAGTTSGSSGGASSATAATTSSSSSSGGSSITISDMDSLVVEVSVSEADITSVAVDQTATITIDAIEDGEFTGAVKSISPNGTSSSGVVNYTVTLTLEPQDGRLKPDMTATADIATQVADNVLTVPVAAVKSNNGSKYVVVLSNGATSNVEVTTGVSDDAYTEIRSGITEGTVVVTGSTSSSASSSSGDSRSGGMMGGAMGGGAVREMNGGGAPPSGGPGGN